MSDPKYDRQRIEANPLWKIAFELPDAIYDNGAAPIGWSKYTTMAICADEITRLRAELDQAAAVISDRNAELAALKAERQWRPIETAPVGKFLLLHWPHWSHFAVIGMKRPHPITMTFQWVAAEALYDDGVQPTHWQPLPAPPEAGDE